MSQKSGITKEESCAEPEYGSLAFNSFFKDTQGGTESHPGTHRTIIKWSEGSGARGEQLGMAEERREGEDLPFLDSVMTKEPRIITTSPWSPPRCPRGHTPPSER